MPIKEKSSFKKFEFEYVGPDGDSCDVTIVEHGDRKYVQFSQPNGDIVTIDGPMLLDMSDKYREIIMSRNRPELFPSGTRKTKRNLQAPKLVDHRQKTSMPEPVEEEVEETKEIPVESISRIADGIDYGIVQTGVDRNSLEQVEETPEEWAIGDEAEELSGWKRDAFQRQQMDRPRIRQHGAAGQGFKRIGASELI